MLKYIAIRPFFSKLCSIYFNSKLSRKDIKPFIEKYGVNIPGVNIKNYKSFNDFFIRRKDVSVDSGLISIADSKLSVYKIDENLKFKKN